MCRGIRDSHRWATRFKDSAARASLCALWLRIFAKEASCFARIVRMCVYITWLWPRSTPGLKA